MHDLVPGENVGLLIGRRSELRRRVLKETLSLAPEHALELLPAQLDAEVAFRFLHEIAGVVRGLLHCELFF